MDTTICHSESPLVYVSDCEYWMINRTNGASNVSRYTFVSHGGINGCSGVVDPTSLRVARWDGSMWRIRQRWYYRNS
ncbi:MAG: hypothetical protein IPO32_00785 [Crocinitomicaceae bacterium]|nr:hypothetical protein [Crocinitomicaceae bacterium]